MTSILIMAEDRTGGGLQRIVEKAAQRVRAARGMPALRFLAAGNVNGGAALLKKCEAYHLLRTERLPRAAHVVYIMDARASWDCVPELRGASKRPWNEKEQVGRIIEGCRSAMVRLARSRAGDWDAISSGFHPHVLVWERESLLLPVLNELDLGESLLDPYAHPDAAGELKRRALKARVRKYSKALVGADLLQRVAERSELLDKVIASNASLSGLVQELAGIE